MNRTRRIATAVITGAALALTVTGAAYAANAANAANPAPGNVAPIAQQRLVDVPGKSIAKGQTQTLVAAGHVGIPANATGVQGFITALHGKGTAILTVWDGVSGAPGTPTVAGNIATEPSGVFHVALNNGTFKVYSRGATVQYLITITSYNVPENAAPVPTFGVAQVWINTKFGNTKWASFTATEQGAPEGDQASGSFRFSCTLPAGCDLSLKAYSTAGGYTVYPRVILEKEDNTDGAKLTCEYIDGANNDNASQALTDTATTVQMGIGGTADCGSTVQTTGGVVDHVNVPGAPGQGLHYDAFVTLTFAKSGS